MGVSEEGLERFFLYMEPLLDERQRRLMARFMAWALGRGDQAAVVRASNMSSRGARGDQGDRREGRDEADARRRDAPGVRDWSASSRRQAAPTACAAGQVADRGSKDHDGSPVAAGKWTR
ncbi:MAG: hypothetical protein ACRDWE_13715, partial [Acidimicrobiales bacterium]